jgi:hypothetical protein
VNKGYAVGPSSSETGMPREMKEVMAGEENRGNRVGSGFAEKISGRPDTSH